MLSKWRLGSLLLHERCERLLTFMQVVNTDKTFKRNTTACLQQNKHQLHKIIQDRVSKTSDAFKLSYANNKAFEGQYFKLLEVVKTGGGLKANERHVNQHGKLRVVDRLRHLLDDSHEFIELSAVAGHRMPYGDIPSAGLITGIGYIHDRPCMLLANDGTVKGGTIFPITLKKQLRAQEIAQELSLPCIYLVDSGGAFLPLQAEIFVEGGKVFFNEAVMSSLGIPQIAVVCGNCTAGGAYVPTMASESVMVHEIGSLFLGGPPLVKAALGEVVSAEDLGGATLHASVSGCVDHFAQDEPEAYAICRDVIFSLNLPPAPQKEPASEPLYSGDDLVGLASVEMSDAQQIIARLVDGSRFHEFKPLYGSGLVTGHSSVHGFPVGILANTDAPFCTKASEKGAHFVQLCTQRNIPMLFLLNMSANDMDCGYDVLKIHGRFMAAVACSRVPKITIVTGRFEGWASYAMGSKALGSNLLFNWPSSSFGTTSSSANLETASRSTASKPSQPAAAVDTTSALYAAANVWTDGIVLPQETRKVIGECLRVFAFSHRRKTDANHNSFLQPTFRM